VSASIRVGCSGFDYDDWRGAFYPDGLPRSHRLSFYAGVFDTVEINSTFYRLPSVATVDRWREAVVDGFCFALKLSQYGSHRKHLADPDQWLGNFVERARRFGPSLGPVLVQLPPHWSADPGRLDGFLGSAPSDMRWAIEVRDERWLCEAVYDVLSSHGAALCIHDLIRGHPDVVTADWVYLRFHGPQPGHPYEGSYSERRLSAMAGKLLAHVDGGRSVYAYFNNDVGCAAPTDASALRRRLERPGTRSAEK
jgi:uncharacterized protein YecE (DUF72 family)